MRCFLGIGIDKELKDRVKKIKEEFKDTGADIKFVGDENLHFTVKFLGDIEDRDVERVDKVEDAVQDFEPFSVNVQGVGVFPSLDFIKVIWMGAEEGGEKMEKMIQDIDETLSNQGFEKESNKIVPHMTIGRMKSGHKKERVAEKVRKLKNVDIGGMKVKEISLFESNLTPEGPVYTKIKKYRL